MIKSVKFEKSVDIKSKEVFFDEKKEILFLGRSNVGKSSLMNALFEKKDLVKTSSMPGKTRTANLFLVNNKYYFTDMPGYGFAKLGKEKKQDLDNLINWYLEERMQYIRTVVVLIDSKLGPQESDIEMYRHLLDMEMDITIVVTKTDKVGNNDIKRVISLCEEAFFGQTIHLVSAKKTIGVNELKKELFKKIVG
ncbi:MAG: ribosome biogenesis GTP-binding protein YihA/YsxC [Candidatus Gracilibacteria bacterium]|nr:ribosome biogenesis GTP-binding protein YihA/YsxC [Candidatus Gracilibacteria bacterium]